MSGRSKRSCVLKKELVPSAAHYVGYVEEDETPEMIMKKFEALERIMAKNKDSDSERAGAHQDSAGPSRLSATITPAGEMGEGQVQLDEAALDDAQLLEVFKATSMFNVKSALANNDMRRQEGGAWSEGVDTDEEEEYMEELRGFWGDGNWDSGASKASGQPSKKQPSGEPRRARVPGAPRAPRTTLVTQYNRDTHALIRRKVRVPDKDAIIQVRVPPPPIPMSWGRAVAPYQPPAPPSTSGAAAGNAGGTTAGPCAAAAAGGERAAAQVGTGSGEATTSGRPAHGSCYCEASDLNDFDFTQLPQRHHLAVLINTGWLWQPGEGSSWQERKAGGAGAALLQRLQQLPVPALCPRGFVFIWAPKEHLAAIVRQMYAWGFVYVENLTWVMMRPNNTILRLPHTYTSKSHVTLMIFRREGEGKDIELRHQRKPDVVFDCVRHAEGAEWQVPPEVYCTIETLLPTGMGAFLELWAARGALREGWTHVAEAGGAHTGQQ